MTPSKFAQVNRVESDEPCANKENKSDDKRQNTLGCLDQYACNVLRLRNSRGRDAV